MRKPSEILALTFTDKAAEEMAVRVDQLVPYGYTDTAISTFHAFGDGLIREYALELGLPTDLRVLTRPEVVIFLREHLFEFDLDVYRPLGDPTRFLAALATLFSRCKDEDIAPADYMAHADRLAAEAAALAEAAAGDEPGDAGRRTPAVAARPRRPLVRRELAGAYATYQRLLAANGCIDFGDQVALALRLVRTSAAARTAIAGRFRYILVDEFQDTNRAQAELVAALADGHRNVTVVGDDDQAIYAFRGAAVDNILAFSDRYPGARTVVLRRNYRSLAPILDAAYRLVRFNDPDRLEVRAGIVKRLRAAAGLADRGPGPARGVRLGRGGGGLDRRRDRTTDRGRRRAARPRDPRPRQRPRRPDPAGAEHGRHPVALLGHVRAVRQARGPPAARVPARRRRPRIERRRLRPRGVRCLRPRWRGPDRDRQHGPPPQPVGLGGPRGGRPAARASCASRPETRATVHRLVADLRGYAEAAHAATCRRAPVSLPARRAASSAGSSATDTPAAEEQLQNIARFFEIVRSQSALLADDRAVFVAPHLATLIEAGDDPATAELDPDADAVAVLTVHKAKGLEFPVVFLPGMVAGRFPSGGQRRRRWRCRPGWVAALPPTAEAGPRRGTSAVLRRDDPGP